MSDEKKPDAMQGCMALCILISIVVGVILFFIGDKDHKMMGLVLTVGGALVSATVFGKEDNK